MKTCPCYDEPMWYCGLFHGRWGWIDSGILAIGIFLRCLKMAWPLTGDECCTFLWYARQPVDFILSTYNTPNNHIFHSVLMHVCYVIFGPNEIALRLPVFLAGVGCIILTWHLAIRLTQDVAVARLAALFVALSRHMVNYSQSGRGYAIAAFLALALTLIVRSDWSKEHGAAWIAAAAVGFLMLLTLPSAIIFLIPFYVFVLWQTPDAMGGRWPVGGAIVLTGMLTAVVYVPLLPDMAAFANGQQTAILPADIKAFLAELWSEAYAGVLNGVLLFFLMFYGFHWSRRGRKFFGLILFGYLTLALALYRWFPFLMFYPRNFGILFPFAYLLCAIGALWGWRSSYSWARWFVAGFVALAMVTGVTETIVESLAPINIAYRIQQDGRAIARKYAGRMKPGDYMRGSPILDGVVLFQYVEHAPSLTLPITSLWFFGVSFAEARQFVRENFPQGAYKSLPVERKGSVLAFRVRRS